MTNHKAWAKAIAQPAKEFPHTPLQVLQGKIPDGLRGSLYINGPARLQRGGVKVGHWFDGDGAILAVHFHEVIGQRPVVAQRGLSDNLGATGVYRYVQTAGYQEESAAEQFLYGNYGMTAPGPIWHQWLKPLKNTANTSVLVLPDRLLALWEGGKPHALDLQTLETYGEDNLGGLESNLPYSAHFKCDSHTGEIFNFGISLGLNIALNLYKSDSCGKIVQKNAIGLDGVSIVHDFILAGQYLVFFIPPVRLNVFPLLAGLSSYSDALTWQPKLGTQILVFDRETLTLVSRGETEPWFQWHFGNGYVDASGSIIIDFVRYADFQQTNQHLKEVATGKTHTTSKGSLWQVHIAPQTGKVIAMQEVVKQSCEFPVVAPEQVGKPWRYTYLVTHRQGVDNAEERYGAIARFDYQTDSLTVADLGENRYPTEPIYALDTLNPHQSWILTVVYDGNSDTSQVWIFDSERLSQLPVCVLELPSVIPPSFHGTWKSA